MPVTVSYPGVYIQEQASGARAIPAVATSIAMFVGMAERGRMDVPVRIFSFADFEREYGLETSGELATQVLQFYLNGGGEAWVCRIANGDAQAAITLESEADLDALTLTARDPGAEGNLIRAEVDYDTASPGRTFNLTVFRSRLRADGTRSRETPETYKGLSMDPQSSSYVETMINGVSALVTATALQANAPAVGGVSIAGRALPDAEASVGPLLATLVTPTSSAFQISVANHPPVNVTLTRIASIANSNVVANIAAQWALDINGALTNASIPASVSVAFSAGTLAGGGLTSRRLLSIASSNGAVVITPGTANDVSVALMLGNAAGGLEGDSTGDFRPAPTGLVARIGTSADRYAAFRRFASAQRDQLTNFNLDDDSPDTPHTSPAPLALGGIVPMFTDGGTDTLANARNVFSVLAAAIQANTDGRWTAARHGFRLVLRPTYGNDNTGVAVVALTTSGGYNIGAGTQPFDPAVVTPRNVAAYTIGRPGGVPGGGTFQDNAVEGLNGGVPLPADYADAYEVIERDAFFNLLVLPRAEGQSNVQRRALWGPASAFCAKQRAFLIVDPDSTWGDLAAAEQGVDQLRIGTETRNAAAYWPRLRVGGRTTPIDPAGSIAGLMARTDGNRGVWKAPAGLEATIRGVAGVDRNMTDPENGVLNLKALNAIRLFPAGVVAWGARTLVGFDGSGNIDDKYIPVRRTMLFIEESLYRGLKFAVFEPNDEPLWAQIRLAAGSFMNGLFRQGAFAGARATDAYFVRCDATTTTPNDINLGIVNVIVGFAPLKPAEFVVVTVTQIAGQAQV